MKKILILGAGTAGTIMAVKLRKRLGDDWKITIIDKNNDHYYQPGFLYIPFGYYSKKDVIKPKSRFIPAGVELIFAEIERIDAPERKVVLKNDTILEYDFLIIATGNNPVPEETLGLTGELWNKKIFEFYTLNGALSLHESLKNFKKGRLVLSIADMPIKCPVAPLEFVFLADAWLKQNRLRNKVDITFVTPLSGAFTKPVATRMLNSLLDEKKINVVTDFYIEKIDNRNQRLVSYDGREIDFDLLTMVPVNMGDPVIGFSGLGDDLNYVPTNKYSLQSDQFENIFVLGDASNLPTSKAGSVIHFAADILFENILSAIGNKPLEARFDGHANCFIETGYGKGTLIDFNYDVEPLPGSFPYPVIGPMKLLKNNTMNHWGKLAFKWIYWNILLKNRFLPIPSKMSMSGKKINELN